MEGGGYKERKRNEEEGKKQEGKECLEGTAKEGKRETKGWTSSERIREEGEGAIIQGSPQPHFHPPCRNSYEMEGHKRKQRQAKSLGNLGDESQGDGAGRGALVGKEGVPQAGDQQQGRTPPGVGKEAGNRDQRCDSDEWRVAKGSGMGDKRPQEQTWGLKSQIKREI